MPIPDLSDDGLLPAGMHDCTINEVADRFGRFQSSDQRCQLTEKLREYVEEAGKTDLLDSLIVDGSFVTSKEQPNDIDLIVVLKTDHDLTAELRPFEYNVLSKRRVRSRYKFDVLVARAGHAEYNEYVAFFERVREQPGRQKGLLRVRP